MDTAVAEQWVVVRDDDYDANYSYAAAKVQAGPFDTLAEANGYIGWDDRFIAVPRPKTVDFSADYARYERICDAADELDREYGNDVARKALRLVEDAHPNADEDHAGEFARLVEAMDAALAEARDTYDFSTPGRSPGYGGGRY